jgi:NADP-dependent 3-hydroxy acid dehydrogenase YdfG
VFRPTKIYFQISHHFHPSLTLASSLSVNMSRNYKMKTVLITGCSSGIGAALALEFARRGLKVIATARTQSDLQNLRESHRNITSLRLDVQEDGAILALKEKVELITGGGLDYLVNNAGAHYASPATDIDITKVRQIFEVNVFAVMQMCEVFSRLLIARKGIILQIGSVTRDVPMICQSPYNATKAALSQYTRTLRLVSSHHRRDSFIDADLTRNSHRSAFKSSRWSPDMFKATSCALDCKYYQALCTPRSNTILKISRLKVIKAVCRLQNMHGECWTRSCKKNHPVSSGKVVERGLFV